MRKILFYLYFILAFSYLVWQMGRYYGYKEGYKKAELENSPLKQLEKYQNIQYGILNDLLGYEDKYSSRINDIIINLKRVKK